MSLNTHPYPAAEPMGYAPPAATPQQPSEFRTFMQEIHSVIAWLDTDAEMRLDRCSAILGHDAPQMATEATLIASCPLTVELQGLLQRLKSIQDNSAAFNRRLVL